MVGVIDRSGPVLPTQMGYFLPNLLSILLRQHSKPSIIVQGMAGYYVMNMCTKWDYVLSTVQFLVLRRPIRSKGVPMHGKIDADVRSQIE